MSQTTIRRTPVDLQISTEECIMRDSAITFVIVDLINSKLQTRRGTHSKSASKNVMGVAEYGVLLYTYMNKYIMV